MKKLSKISILIMLMVIIFQLGIENSYANKEQSSESNERYELLPISIKQLKAKTILDRDGSVWYLSRTSRAGGYQWLKPVAIPGMNKGVLIDDKICLQSDGSIWSWEIEGSGRDSKVIEHILGYVPKDLNVSEVVKILKYDTFILLLDNNGNCWYVYTYDKVIQIKLRGLQEAKPLFHNIKDIGYGFALYNDNQLFWFDMNDGSKENIRLNLIMKDIKQLASGKHDTLVLDSNGTIYYIGNIDYYLGRNLSDIQQKLPFALGDLPKMVKIWNASPHYFQLGLGIDDNNQLLAFSTISCYDDKKDSWKNTVRSNPVAIYDYYDFDFTWSDIIVHKNDGTSKAWFTYWKNSFWFNQKQTIGPEVRCESE